MEEFFFSRRVNCALNKRTNVETEKMKQTNILHALVTIKNKRLNLMLLAFIDESSLFSLFFGWVTVVFSSCGGYIQSEAIIRRFVVVRTTTDKKSEASAVKFRRPSVCLTKAEYSNWISFECIIKASFNLLLTTLDPHSSLESVEIFFFGAFFSALQHPARWCCEGLSIVWCICVRCLSLNGPPDWNDNYERKKCLCFVRLWRVCTLAWAILLRW